MYTIADFENISLWFWYNQLANGVKETDESKFQSVHDVYYIVQDS